MIVNAELNFPVLRVHNSFIAGGKKRSERNFFFCGSFVLNEWTDHTHHYILDASGSLYKVNSIREAKWGSLSIGKKIKLRLTNLAAPILHLKKNSPQSVWIEHDLSFVRHLNIVDAREFIASEALRLNTRWKSDGPSIREFRGILDGYATLSDLTGSSIAEGR